MESSRWSRSLPYVPVPTEEKGEKRRSGGGRGVDKEWEGVWRLGDCLCMYLHHWGDGLISSWQTPGRGGLVVRGEKTSGSFLTLVPGLRKQLSWPLPFKEGPGTL